VTEAPWTRIQTLFERALELPPERRRELVERDSAGDRELESEVLSLLEHADEDDAIEAILERGCRELVTPGPGAEYGEPGPKPGDRVGPYRLERRIGRGGMGSVWLAVRDDDEFEQRVAIKLVSADGPASRLVARFRAERQILAGLEHPNISRLLDGGSTADGQPYLVMEYVEGETLLDHCDRRRAGVRERVELFRKVCAAVDHAHRRLVVHRDLKPANILVDRAGTPKLLDFGIAKLLSREPSAEGEGAVQPGLTRPQERLLTPDYASPEQVRGEPVTIASDVYSLGAGLYELLTGRRARRLEGLGPAAVERELTGTTPIRPSTVVRRGASGGEDPDEVSARCGLRPEQLARRLRGDLDTIVLEALHPDPERRYATAAELSADLGRYLEGRPVLARRDSALYRARKLVGRHPVSVATAAGVVVLVVAFVVGLAVQSRRLAAERDRALAAEHESRTVSGFLTDLFQVADPSESRGETVTARELLDRGSALIATELGDQPRARASLVATLASVYRDLGLRTRAVELSRQALELRRGLLGEDHLDTAASFDQLGDLLRQVSRYDEAEELLRRGLAVREARLDALDPAVAGSLNNLGLLLLERGRAEEAEPLLGRSLEIRRRVLGEDHRDTNVSRSNLGQLLSQAGRLEQAETLLRETLASRERTLGEDHPQVIHGAHVLASVLHGRGRYAEAETLLRRAIELRRRVQGDRHPELASSLNNLAALLHDLGRLEEAEPLYREGLEIGVELYGQAHADVVANLNNLASLLQDRGRYEEARELFSRSLEIRRELFGEDSASYARALHNLGVLETMAGDPVAGEEWLARALDWRRRELPEDHPEVAQSLLGVGVAERAMGRLEGSRERIAEALAIFERALRPRHPRIVLARGELAWTLAELGETERCVAGVGRAREALASQERESDVDRGRVELAAGICLAAAGDRTGAIAALGESRSTLRRSFGDGNAWVQEAERRLERLDAD